VKSVDLLAAETLTDAQRQAAEFPESHFQTPAATEMQTGLDQFLLWSLEIFDAQAPHERGVRFIAGRSVVELGGVPKCFIQRLGGFGNAACRYANRIYARSQADRLLSLISFGDLCELEKSGQIRQLPAILAHSEQQLLERCYGDLATRRRTALALKRSISAAAWELALRIAWRRYGPTILIALGSGVAFAVAVLVWLRESGLNLLPLMEEWWLFILAMLRGH
jgi:hypothetical protein